MNDAESDSAFDSLLDYLKRSRGFNFAGYKRSGLRRRVSKRVRMTGRESFADYQDYLEVHPEEFSQLFDTILINVTSFFRDPSAWDSLAQEVIPRIAAAKKTDSPIRVWSVGCASGEETYTLAIVLAETLGLDAFDRRVKIYATDVDEDALSHARLARYSAQDLKAIPDALHDKYFELVEDHYVFRSNLRRSVVFGRHDLLQDSPISRLDLLTCRNTLMYFNTASQARILARFHYALNDSGYLFLGKAETLLTHANLFSPINLKHRIFAKVPRASSRDRMSFFAPSGIRAAINAPEQPLGLPQAIFDASPFAQIVVNPANDLVLISRRACSLFNLDSNDVGRPFQDLELSYHPVDLRTPLKQAYTERRATTLSNVEFPAREGALQYLDVQVIPLEDDDGSILGVSITFQDMTRFQQLEHELQQRNQELEMAYEKLQSTNEELETTNEELQSTVEELETTNEELQSTNEEMETVNAELQAINEELHAINDQLRRRTDDFNGAYAFLESILASLNSAVIAVDQDFIVLIWNHRSEDLWGLRSDEVKGQSLLSLDIGLPVEQLSVPIRTVLTEKANGQEVVLDAINRRGQSIRCRVTCTPRLGANKQRQGVILVMDEQP